MSDDLSYPGEVSALSRSLESCGRAIQEIKVAKGWTVTTPEKWEEENQIPADLALIHSEVSEALEAFRRGDREAFAEELADVMIRAIGLGFGLKIDMGSEVMKKIAKNRARAHRHGGKRL
jgi:NTP pyrophosphatase (non-canonical NTP hydrolase)